MKKMLYKKRFLVFILFVIFLTFTYCSLQAFPMNDDLPYSLFYRGTERVTSIRQIIRNQISDYYTINGRFFVHCVVQFMLMFDRYLFSIVNSVCIIVTFVFMKKIIKLNLDDNKIKISDIYIYMIIVSLFLLIYKLKYLIYWIAGSVNYIWIYSLLIIFIYYYLKRGLLKNKLLNSIIFIAFSAIHECSFVFMLFLITGDFINNCIKEKKLNNIYIYLLYITLTIVGGCFVIKAPGNAIRMSASQWWYDLSFAEQLNLSLPIISKQVFGIFDFNNIIPTIFLLVTCIYMGMKGNKLLKLIDYLIIIFSCISFITNNGWFSFISAVLLFCMFLIYNFKEKKNCMSVLLLAFYAVSFSMAITPEFNGGRPNYYIYMFMIIYIVIFVNILSKKKFIKIFIIPISITLFIITMLYELKIYSYIGSVKQDRMRQIEKVKSNHLNVLKYKKIDEHYAKYHADANSPDGKEYWAYKYFISYYNLPKNLEIQLVE